MKFKVGEIALIVNHVVCDPAWPLSTGDEVTILEIVKNEKHPYAIDVIAPDGRNWGVSESWLRKRPPPEKPAEEEFQDQLKNWLKRKKNYLDA